MLPKIIVTGIGERDILLKGLKLSPSLVIGYEGKEGKVDDLRHWINFGVNTVSSSPEMILIVWDADRLSPECQAILLKPLEETGDRVKLFLFVSNENGLLPTVLSRCLVESLEEIGGDENNYWREAMKCLINGPAESIDLSERLTKEEMERSLVELIKKLQSGLIKEVNKNRLKVLKKAIDCLAKLRFTNVNAKLAFSNFLISSWKLIRA
ncbi:MAG TPA: hypothetical protein PLI45_00645 [Candidatus Woesebacteria bacterium]|nr:hypothetical protein [Candidatus Woesebacteria bacterium]